MSGFGLRESLSQPGPPTRALPQRREPAEPSIRIVAGNALRRETFRAKTRIAPAPQPTRIELAIDQAARSRRCTISAWEPKRPPAAIRSAPAVWNRSHSSRIPTAPTQAAPNTARGCVSKNATPAFRESSRRRVHVRPVIFSRSAAILSGRLPVSHAVSPLKARRFRPGPDLTRLTSGADEAGQPLPGPTVR